MSKTILIGEMVTAATGSDFLFEGQQGEVMASRQATDGSIEHFIKFPPRTYTDEEKDRGDDTFPPDNQCWLRADEVTKVEQE